MKQVLVMMGGTYYFYKRTKEIQINNQIKHAESTKILVYCVQPIQMVINKYAPYEVLQLSFRSTWGQQTGKVSLLSTNFLLTNCRWKTNFYKINFLVSPSTKYKSSCQYNHS